MALTATEDPAGAAVHWAPDPRLRSVVAGGYDGWTTQPGRTSGFVVPAHASVQLVIKVEDSALRPSEFVHGTADRPTVIDGGCAPRYLQLDLTPLGAYRVFGVPMHQLAGRLVDLADVLGADGRRLGAAVRDAPTWRGRFQAVDRYLIGRVGSAPAVTGDVALAWLELKRSSGSVPIRAICREVGWSHKHLITRFKEQVGLTPKRAARVIRFEQVLRRLDAVPRPDWARLATECGYADQAHLIREFAEFTGSTPAAAAAGR